MATLDARFHRWMQHQLATRCPDTLRDLASLSAEQVKGTILAPAWHQARRLGLLNVAATNARIRRRRRCHEELESGGFLDLAFSDMRGDSISSDELAKGGAV